MKLKSLFILVLIALSVAGCRRPEIKMAKRMMGEWKIERSERLRIYEDGSTWHFEDIENAGTLTVTEAVPEATFIRSYSFQSVNFEGDAFSLGGDMWIDEDATRAIWKYALCEGLFECDLVWTIEENKRNKQVWSAYGNQDAFFWTGDSWNAGDDASHLKWRITLVRE